MTVEGMMIAASKAAHAIGVRDAARLADTGTRASAKALEAAEAKRSAAREEYLDACRALGITP